MNAKDALKWCESTRRMVPSVEEAHAWNMAVDALREKVAREEAAKPREPIPWERLREWCGDSAPAEVEDIAITRVLRVVEEQVVPYLEKCNAAWIFAALDKARTPGA